MYAQLIDFVIRYKRTILIKNEDGQEVLEEEDDFMTVQPADLEQFKHQLVHKAEVNEETKNLEVSLDIGVLLKVFEADLAELKVLKLYYHSKKNNKMLWLEALINKKLQYLIKATATRSVIQSEISSLISEQLVNPEDQRY